MRLFIVTLCMCAALFLVPCAAVAATGADLLATVRAELHQPDSANSLWTDDQIYETLNDALIYLGAAVLAPAMLDRIPAKIEPDTECDFGAGIKRLIVVFARGSLLKQALLATDNQWADAIKALATTQEADNDQ